MRVTHINDAITRLPCNRERERGKFLPTSKFELRLIIDLQLFIVLKGTKCLM